MSAAGNAKHQVAVAAAAEHLEVIRVELHMQLEVIRDLHPQIEELFDSRQSVGLGFMTDDARKARDKQTREDRAAARGGTLASLGDVAKNVRWARSTTVLGTGEVAAPVTVTAVSVSAEIVFALKHQVRRLARPAALAAAAAVPGGKGRLPLGLPTTDADVDKLTRELDDLVDVYTSPQGLKALMADLEHLEEQARNVIDGPERTNHPDPCPWCGRKTLAIYGASRKMAGRDAIYVRCEGKHPCVCDDDWCPCHRNPVRHRHEWINSGGSKNPMDGRSQHSLTTLIARSKELAVLEPRALNALERIRELHQPFWTDSDGHRHNYYVTTSEPPVDHICVIDGFDRCSPEEEEHVVPACVECRQTYEDAPGSPFWPCPTYQATDLDQPADDQVADTNTKE